MEKSVKGYKSIYSVLLQFSSLRKFFLIEPSNSFIFCEYYNSWSQ